MPEIDLKSNPQGQLYLKEEIRRDFDNAVSYKYIGNKLAGVLFPDGVSYKDVLKSLKVAIRDIEHRAELEKEKE